MNFKRTAVVLGFALLAVAGLIVYALTRPDDDVTSSERLFPGISGVKPEQIDSLEIVRTQPKDEKLVFTRDVASKRWTCTSPQPANVDSQAIDLIVSSLISLKPIASPQLTGDPGAHGLAKPSVMVTIRQGSNMSATLNIGLTTIGGDNAVTFVTTSANPTRPLAVKQSSLAGLFKDSTKSDGEAWTVVKSLTDLRAKRLLGSGLRDLQLDIKTIRLKSGPKDLKLESVGTGDWQFVVPATFGDADTGGDRDVNMERFTGVRPLLNYLSTLTIINTADVIEAPTSEAIAKYGLKTDEAMRIELTDQTGRTETLLVGKIVDDKDPTKKRYVRLDGDSCVIMLPIDRYDALLRTVADPTDLRNRDVIAGSTTPSIDGVDFVVGGQTIKARRYGTNDAQKWYIVGGPADPSEANIAKLDQFLQTISRPRLAVDFPAKADESAYAGAELKATITLWRNAMGQVPLPQAGKPTPEPPIAEGAIPITLLIGTIDGTNVRVKKTEAKRTAEFLLANSLLSLIPKSRLDLLAAAVPTYPTNTVSRLMLDRPSGRVDVMKDTKPDPLFPLGKWSFAKPDDRKGKPADQPKTDGLIGTLAALRGQTVVAEKPTDEQLKSFGFLPTPRMNATVEFSTEAGKSRTYEFGIETPDRNFVYARHSLSPLVYTVPKADVDRLISEDLRDAMLYRIDRSKLNGLTIRGWTGRIPVPPTHEYAKTGSEWKCISPKDTIADPQKLAALLGHLEQPRAVNFLGPVKPEYKLDPANGAIEVTLKQDGLPPIVVTLGAQLDGGLNYAATVSTIPGEAVSISASAIRVFAGTPEGLLITKSSLPTMPVVQPQMP